MGALAWVVTMDVLESMHGAVVIGTLFVALVVGTRNPISLLGGDIIISGETIPLVAAIVLVPEQAPVLALCIAYLAPASSPSVRLLGGSQVVVATLAASLATTLAHGSITGTVVATITLVATSILQVLAYEWFVWRAEPRDLLPPFLGSLVATTAFTMPIVAATTSIVLRIGPIALPLLLVPLAITQYFHGLYHRKVQLTDELAEKAQVLARTNLQFAAAMVKALDARDAYTAGHSAAVAVYTRDIAREMGFDDETVRLAHLAGLLHDIGKIGVPGRVLNKTAPLDDEEYELMKSHAAMGAEILAEVDLYADIAILVRYHHERIDGKGYPDGIAGDAIPAISRMISVADTYSAMTTDRPYRDGMPTEKAMGILRECRGTQLDADFTDAFLRILIVADAAYQRGKQTDFEVEVAKHQALSEVEAEAVRVNAPTPVGPQAPAATVVPTLPAAVDGEVVEVDLEREAA
jgi:putative nucleotidyltransferase with HDIG domain